LSHAKPALEQGAIRNGLGFVRGIGEEKANTIVEVRGDKPFTSLVDVIARTKLPRRVLEALILAGALDRLGDRRQLLWDLAEALDIAQRPPQLPLTIPGEHVSMQPFTADEQTFTAFTETGVTVDRDITELKRDAFDQAQCLRLWQLQRTPIGATVRIGGIMADEVRTPPTAKGTGFMRLERLEGFVDVIIPAPLLEDRTSRKALRYAFLVIEGTLQQRGAVISVVAHTVCPLDSFRDCKRNETNPAHSRVQALKVEAGVTRI
jgi:DNA polymerase III alpha subunit